jgi:hypothetical protein
MINIANAPDAGIPNEERVRNLLARAGVPSKRMNSPLDNREVRLRGLQGGRDHIR